jgi:hypothetical protein
VNQAVSKIEKRFQSLKHVCKNKPVLVRLHDRIDISGDRYTLFLRQDMLDRVGHRLGKLDQKRRYLAAFSGSDSALNSF